MKRVFSILALLALSGGIAFAGGSQESTATAGKVKTLSIFINDTWYPTKTFTGIIPEQITKDTGVKLDPTIAVNDQQLGVMIASGSLPDLVYTPTLLGRLSDSNVSYDYESLIKKYNVDWKISPEQRANALSFSTDGKLYTVLNHFATTAEWKKAPAWAVPIEPSLFLRKDLLEQLGNPPIHSLSDLTKVFAMVKAKWPNIIPFTFDYSWRFQVLQAWEGLPWTNNGTFVKQSDGSYQYSVLTGNYYNMLKLLNEWYQKGYMTADSFSATNTTALAPYEQGKAFSLSSCTQNNNASVQAYLTKVNPDYVSIESMPLSDNPYVSSDIGWSGTFITKNAKDPEAAIKFVAWMFTPRAQMLTQNGRAGTDYTTGPNGVPQFSAAWKEAVANGTQAQVYDPWFYLGGSAIDEAIGRIASLPNFQKYYQAPYEAINKQVVNRPWVSAALPKAGTDQRTIYDSLVAMIPNFEAKTIMSPTDAAFQQNYDAYMAAAKKAGVDQLDAYMSKMIPQVEQRYQAGSTN
ncbi:MAG TPA: extracellular solute-binding protein [Spirochaetia bacterium]|nr:extracellular solute-binding protein [Spirochaetia bacterium]